MNAEATPGGRDGLLHPVTRPVTLGQSAYEALLDLVITGRLQPGQHLVETDLARQLRVSRQPVREALHRLQAEGWITLRPNEGAFVHVPTGREVDELLDVRELLEGEAARLAAARAGPSQVARLRAICREGEAAIKHSDTERFVAVNTDFHAALADMAGNTVLAGLAEVVTRRARWYYRLVAASRMRESNVEHVGIAEAVAAADGKRAGELARAHIQRTRMAYHRLAGRG